MSFLSDLTPAIDNIIRELRNDGFNPARVKSLVYKSIQFLPSLRNEHNIPLLTVEILSSRSLLLPDLITTDYLVDGFRSAIARKYSITDPTIPCDEWTGYLVNPVVERLSNEKVLWRSLPLLAGVVQAMKYEMLKGDSVAYVPSVKDLRFYQDLYVKIFNQIITLPLRNGHDYDNYLDIINMALVTLAKCQWALDGLYNQLQHSEVIVRGLDLIYLYRDTSVLRELEKTVLPPSSIRTPSTVTYNLLGGFSQIIRQSVESNYKHNLSFNHLDEALNQIYLFTDDLSKLWLRLNSSTANPDQWNVLKQFIFAICLQLQGFAGLLLHVNNPRLLSSSFLSCKILKTLSPVYFIIDKLGSSFEPFNFTYDVCIDVIILDNKSSSDSLIQSLAGSCNLGAVFSNEMERGKIIYLIDLFEKLINFSSTQTINNIILPFIEEFLTPHTTQQATMTALLESSHTVMLQYLLLPKEKIIINDNTIIKYFDTLLSLFPLHLSTHQFLLALNTIAKSVITKKPNLTNQFLDQLYIKCKSTMPGLPLPTDRKQPENGPPTIRAVFVSGLIHALPLLEPIAFQFWLQTVYGLFVHMGPYFSPLFQAENEYLQQELEIMISSELDLSLSDIGIRFWHGMSKL